jgi:hypothetical protein
MPEAYRSNTEGEEEKYQEALLLYREKVQYARGLSWVYTQRKARERAGFIASLSALVCFPVSFWLFISAFFQGSKDPLRLLAWQWWPHSLAFLLALVPPLIFWLVYKFSLQTKPTELEALFEVPRRVASTPESTNHLQEQKPIEKFREECAKIASGSCSWSFTAISFLSTQLPLLLLLVVVSLVARVHHQSNWHCWIDLTVIVLLVSSVSFLGFYPFIMSLRSFSKTLVEDSNLTLEELKRGAHEGSLAAMGFAFLGVLVAGAIVIVPLILSPLQYALVTPLTKAYLFFGLLVVPLAAAYILGIKVTPKNLQKIQETFAKEHEALYPPKR